MADILEFLKQKCHIEKAKQEELCLSKAADGEYKSDNTLFKLPLAKVKGEGGNMKQFCQFYFRRLE